MPLTVSNNSAVAAASHYLGKNQQALQLSIKKLASGSRLIGNPDPGTLSVAMRLDASVTRLVGAKNNVQNGMSFVEVQDGMLQSAGRIVGRMAELKGMATQDPMKSSQDIASYDNEFADLQVQLHQISQQTFNGASLFAATTTRTNTTATVFRGGAQLDNTISIFTSSNGSAGTGSTRFKSTRSSKALTGATCTPRHRRLPLTCRAQQTLRTSIRWTRNPTTTMKIKNRLALAFQEGACHSLAFRLGGRKARLCSTPSVLVAPTVHLSFRG